MAGKPRALQIRSTNGAAQGKPVAHSKSCGKGKTMSHGSALSCIGKRMEGIVTSWKKDWGWIDAGYPEDVFAHLVDMRNGIAPATGTQVMFTVGVDSKTGKARALEITKSARGGGGQLKQSFQRQTGMKSFGLGTFANYIGQPMQGQVTSWKDQWGWISVPGFQEDIFAHLSDSLDGIAPSEGSMVSFFVGMRSDKPRAMQIQNWSMNFPVASLKRKSIAVRAAPGKKPVNANAMGEVMEGEVVSFKAPWGWVSCPSLGSDLFAHMDDFAPGLTHLQIGQVVTFTAAPDPSKEGRMRAFGISLPGGTPPAKKRRVGAASTPRVSDKGFENAEGSILNGTVVSWKDKWGWISAGEEFEGDIFAHVDDVVDGVLESGSTVSFTVGKDDKTGRWRARQINAA